MSRLHRQSIRQSIRTITLLAAVTSLLLTLVTPFLGTAHATLPGSSFDGTDASLDPGVTVIDDTHCGGGATDDVVDGGLKLNTINSAPPPVINPSGNAPGHSDLCRVALGTQTLPDRVYLYLAWERHAITGSSGALWEFQQSALACTTSAAGCNPWANRQAGDFIIAYDFDGNSVGDLGIRIYNGTSFGPIHTLTATEGEMSVRADRKFGEAVIDLTDLGILDPAARECESFAGVIPTSFTGNSGGDQAQYQDVVLTDHQPALTNCGQLLVEKLSSTGADYGDTFPITLAGAGGTVNRTENLGHGGSFTQVDAFAGNDYSVSEVVPAGWAIDSIVCSDNSSSGAGITQLTGISVVVGQTTKCTVTNSPDLPTITLVKTVQNDFGGTATAGSFQGSVSSVGNVAWGAATPVSPGTYTASETVVANYVPGDWGQDCDADGNVTVALGDDVTCTITNFDTPASLTVIKQVVNDNGGSLHADDFGVATTAGPLTLAPADAATAQDTVTGLSAGTYTVSEAGAPGYVLTSLSCDNGQGGPGVQSLDVDVAMGQDVTCTLVNDDVPPGLTVVKQFDLNYGGSSDPTPFTLNIYEGTDAGGTLVATGNTSVMGIPQAGTYFIEEEIPAGLQDQYALQSITCLDADTQDTVGAPSGDGYVVTVGVGQTVNCFVVNVDLPGSLTVIKEVTNDDGGTLHADDFGVATSAGPLTLAPANADIAQDTVTDLAAGTYSVTEDDVAGYTLTSLSCDNGQTALDPDPTIGLDVQVGLGEHVICTLVNDDDPISLTIVKQVFNDHGGVLDATGFGVTLDGTVQVLALEAPQDGADSQASITITPIPVGTYEIGEQGAADYTLQSITCTNGDSGTPTVNVSLALGDQVTCTLVNDDDPGRLTVVKEVINDDGGLLHADDFGVAVGGTALAMTPADADTASDTVADLAAGTYTITEDDVAGYTLTSLSCDDGQGALDPDPTIGLDVQVGIGDDITCTLVNDDEPGTLILTKQIESPNGGTATEADFTPTIDGGDASWGDNEVEANVAVTVDEIDAAISSYLADGEYVQVSIECDGQPTNIVTVPNGETRECIIVNRDVPAGLTVVKQVRNNWGGGLTPGDFPLTIDGDTVASGAFATFPAGDHTIAEQQQPNYELVSLTCVSDRLGILDLADAETVSIVVGLNENVVCTFVNRDQPPSLTVLKDVVNDDGGTATEGDFTPLVNGVETGWGDQHVTIGDQTGTPVGDYEVGEIGFDGYEMTGITCTDDTALADGADTLTVGIELGDDITCTVVNDDIAPTVVLHKVVVNDDGGTATQDDFAVTFDGDEATWDEVITTTVGDHAAAEETAQGYLPGDWTGDCASDGSLTTAAGGTYECTITNDDVPAGLTVIKEVINDDGGTAEPGDFSLLVTPEGEATITVTSGSETIVGAGTYTVSEEQLPGYTLDSITCDNGVTGSDGEATVEIGLDEAVICTLVNNDLPIGIEIVKVPNVEEVEFVPGPPDEIITYTYTITNTGEVRLSDLVVVDDVLGGIEVPIDVLEPGETIVVTADHVVTAADAEAGQVVNVVVVEGTSPDGRTTTDEDTATVTVTDIPVEVLPEVITKPQPPAVIAKPQLPATGIDTGMMAMLSGLLAALGLTLLAATKQGPSRHRRHGRHA